MVPSTSFLFNASYVNNQDEISITITWGLLNYFMSSSMVIDDSRSIQQVMWLTKPWMETIKQMCSAPMDNVTIMASAETDSSSCSLFECKCSPDEWDIRCIAWLYEETHGMLKWRRFVKVAKVKVPDMSSATMYMNLSWKACEQECLRNCSLSASVIRWSGRWNQSKCEGMYEMA